MQKRRYRVAQWATGNIGLRSLRTVIEHPDLDLVGLYVYSDSKAGRDAGELCGLSPVGVKATRDIEEIVALKPDCVLYMPSKSDIDELCRLLESGANVVSTAGELHRPESMDSARRERIEDACRRGQSTVHATGSSPGFISEAVPLVLTSILRRLDSVTIDEYADMSSRNSPEMIFALFGGDPAQFDPTALRHSGFEPSFRLIADAFSTPLDEVIATGDIAVALHDVDVAAGTIKAGTVAARLQETTGSYRGEPIVRMRQTLYVTTDLDKAWELPPSSPDVAPAGWRIQVQGDTPLDVRISFPVPVDDWAATSPGLTAHRPVNAVRYLCEAEPGIKTTLDLPQIVATFG